MWSRSRTKFVYYMKNWLTCNLELGTDLFKNKQLHICMYLCNIYANKTCD